MKPLQGMTAIQWQVRTDSEDTAAHSTYSRCMKHRGTSFPHPFALRMGATIWVLFALGARVLAQEDVCLSYNQTLTFTEYSTVYATSNATVTEIHTLANPSTATPPFLPASSTLSTSPSLVEASTSFGQLSTASDLSSMTSSQTTEDVGIDSSTSTAPKSVRTATLRHV